MDSRRPPYQGHPPQAPPPPPPPPPPHHDPRQQQQQHQPANHHYAPQPPPPPPPSYHPQHHSGPPPPHTQAQGPPHQQQQHHPAPYQPGPPAPERLPPIQAAYAQQPTSASSTDQPTLPSFRQPSAPPQHDPRDGAPPEHYHPYNHNRSGHATPAPVNRSYSHDSGHQRSPATPAGPGPGSFPPSQAQDGAQQPPGQPPHHMEHGHHGYPPTNGHLPHGLPPPGPQHHPESHPQQQMTPMMDNHYQAYGPPPPNQQPMGYAQYNSGPVSTMYGQKRKQMRATQACEQCRQRKQKCDEGSPCSFCKENNLSCQYRDTPPAKTDKNMEKLLSYMEAHSAGLQELTNKIDSFEVRLRHVEQNAQRDGHTQRDNHTQRDSHTLRDSHTVAGAGIDEGRVQDEPLPVKRKPELDDHRTAPHKLLLLWPSVRPLLAAAHVEHNDGYVMEAEDRGVLRLWTRGEGIDENDGTQPGGPASPARSEDSGEGANAPTPHAEGLWGSGFPSTPGSDVRRSDPYGAGGLKPNGEIDLDANVVNRLYDSYMKSLHIMHPFLDKRRLRRMFDVFIKRYSTGRPRATFAVGMQHDSDHRPMKRQRSNGSTANPGTGSDHDMRREQTERSPGNAIIYLVLALGKICEWRDPLPSIVPDSKLQANTVVSHQISGMRGFAASSPISANIKPSPMSPKSTPTTQPTPPSEANLRLNDSRSRRSSVEGSPMAPAGPRNLDVIPGVAYYAKAAEILGDQGDGNDLVHAQMFLLAGLYKGQLARVKESMSWFSMAGRAIMILLDRYKLYNDNYWEAYGDVRRQHERAQNKIKDTRQSLIVLASWSCLQLESDILAELRLPSSNIQTIENLLLMPHKVDEVDDSYSGLDTDAKPEDYDTILLFYTSQLFLRRKLNQVHQEMYGPGCLGMPISAVQTMLQEHESLLSKWRDGLPDKLQWDDSDAPPSDILAARLRAKYWGARYIINRPFLDYALHIMALVRDGTPVEKAARDGHGNPRDKAEIHLFKAIQKLGDEQVWTAAKRCIHAAMQSTVAFDGVDGRLVVTNIHGTAHAQFGNMLVLSAAYESPLLGTWVPQERFQQLMQRTITFLRRLAPISPTSAADCGILEKFNKILFPTASEEPHVYKNEGVEAMSATASFGTGT
ncbi:uncharacterized protein CLAFUR5_09229 [Fulvia fulva]|uniref:Zn(2)-C6 fungal-type domain-containing protein n=1 Tax=Passalora fulva TaxID=5499 RepID=A0A9Q8PFS5_PASFU|nr:uncharacterized protein CLAFUR5_09229 [Fulvia fulva]KAK4614344.1 hypothetical protein CLAFUR0_09116 [Fulvia fulva]UJO21607.1 hypothetical protein CLAFUR5_09229 [Fulvia fulva]